MEAFDVVNVIKEPADVPVGVGKVLVVGKVHLLFFDGADEPPGVTVFLGLADSGHAELDAAFLQGLHIGAGGILQPLVGVMDFWQPQGLGLLQSPEGELLPASEPGRRTTRLIC